MESNESLLESNESLLGSSESLLESSEATKNRSPESPKSTTTDTEEKPTYIRFLVSNAGAGSVIGKGGSSIGDLQSKSGARIQLSRNHEFFPGTTERIIWISGSIDNIITAVDLVLVKLQNELNAEDGNDVESTTKVRLIVPNSCCGCIIGKGGSTIKSFMEDSQAGIRISRLDTSYFGMSDRLVTVTGSLDEQMRAIDLILTKLTYESHYSESFVAPYSYQGVFFSDFPGVPYGYLLPNVATLGYSTINYGPNGGRGKFQNQKEDLVNSVTLSVSDEHIGLVVGRGGRNIMELNQITGARIKISGRGDFMPGTTDRKVTITGTQRAIREAESMILKKVEYASEKAAIA